MLARELCPRRSPRRTDVLTVLSRGTGHAGQFRRLMRSSGESNNGRPEPHSVTTIRVRVLAIVLLSHTMTQHTQSQIVSQRVWRARVPQRRAQQIRPNFACVHREVSSTDPNAITPRPRGGTHSIQGLWIARDIHRDVYRLRGKVCRGTRHDSGKSNLSAAEFNHSALATIPHARGRPRHVGKTHNG